MDAEGPLGLEALQARAEAALGAPAAVLGAAPGRINIIGEHTDYIGGLALPVAVDRQILVALRPLPEPRARVRALDLDEVVSWDLGAPPAPEALDAGWARYVVGCVCLLGEELQARGRALPGGLEAVVTGDVPLGSGISSSAALCLAWVNALAAWTELDLAPLARARLAQGVEHEWAGVQCGLLDQVASQLSVRGFLLRVDFAGPSPEQPLVDHVDDYLAGVRWVLLHTGVHRALAGSAYAERVAQVAEGLARSGLPAWRQLPGEGGLVGLAERLGDEVLLRRLRHGITENQRVRLAVEAVAWGDAAHLGRLLCESHASLRDDYAVSCPELDLMQALARATPGCHGARMMGGGFGGCVLALVDEGVDLGAAVLPAYRARFEDRAPRVLEVSPASGARGWRVD